MKKDNDVHGADIARSGAIPDIIRDATGVDLSIVDTAKIKEVILVEREGGAYVSTHITDEQLFGTDHNLKFKKWEEALVISTVKHPSGQCSADLKWLCINRTPLVKVDPPERWQSEHIQIEKVHGAHLCIGRINPKIGEPLLLCGGCGGRKSTQIRNFITRQDKERKVRGEHQLKIRFLSVRRSHAHDAKKELQNYGWLKDNLKCDDFRSYLHKVIPIDVDLSNEAKEDETRRRAMRFHRFIVSFESFHRVPDIKYDVIILDELRSLLANFGSETLWKQVRASNCSVENLARFQKVLQDAPYIIGADADMEFDNAVSMFIKIIDKQDKMLQTAERAMKRKTIFFRVLNN